MKIELARTETIHFVGIGGIGMSGLASIMKGLGFKVQGSDINLNKNIEILRKNKIKVYIGHNKKNISNSTILVISSAIKQSNKEILFAKKKNLPIYRRGDMLAHIVSLLKRNIVVAGSHHTPIVGSPPSECSARKRPSNASMTFEGHGIGQGLQDIDYKSTKTSQWNADVSTNLIVLKSTLLPAVTPNCSQIDSEEVRALVM